MNSFEEDAGPYLPCAHARLYFVVSEADSGEMELIDADLSLLVETYARYLVRLLLQWPNGMRTTYTTQEPVMMLTYLFRLTHMLSSSYDHLNIVRSEAPLKHAMLALYVCAKKVLHSGIRILCVTLVER